MRLILDYIETLLPSRLIYSVPVDGNWVLLATEDDGF